MVLSCHTIVWFVVLRTLPSCRVMVPRAGSTCATIPVASTGDGTLVTGVGPTVVPVT